MRVKESKSTVSTDVAHEPPTITRLGTLSELTLGGGGNTDDLNDGFNGDEGSG